MTYHNTNIINIGQIILLYKAMNLTTESRFANNLVLAISSRLLKMKYEMVDRRAIFARGY